MHVQGGRIKLDLVVAFRSQLAAQLKVLVLALPARFLRTKNVMANLDEMKSKVPQPERNLRPGSSEEGTWRPI